MSPEEEIVKLKQALAEQIAKNKTLINKNHNIAKARKKWQLLAEKRHFIPDTGVCWCGSGHDWVLARDGFCECTDPRCNNGIHRV